MIDTDMNKRFLDALIEWESASHFPEIARAHNLSRPYVCSVTDYYVSAGKRIMIIGQETFGWPRYDSDWPVDDIQKWGIRYLEKQLWNIGDENYNPSPFWRLFRFIDKQFGYCPCWNNVDKAHQIVGGGKTVPLSCEVEKALNPVILTGGNTILQEEISIADPDVVLFATGPYYSKTMALSLGINEEELDRYKPTPDRLCSDFSELARLRKLVIWTYHPNYLNLKGLFPKATAELKKKLQ